MTSGTRFVIVEDDPGVPDGVDESKSHLNDVCNDAHAVFGAEQRSCRDALVTNRIAGSYRDAMVTTHIAGSSRGFEVSVSGQCQDVVVMICSYFFKNVQIVRDWFDPICILLAFAGSQPELAHAFTQVLCKRSVST